VDKIIEISKRFEIYEDPPRQFSMALGAHETTLLKMTTAYATLASGGAKVKPTLVERIHDREGHMIYKADERHCVNCKVNIKVDDKEEEEPMVLSSFPPPFIPHEKEQIVDEVSNYQLISILEGAVKRGTARRATSLGIHIAGKTGTTNNSNDAWFVGFTNNLVVGTYVGYDSPLSLGEKETGASVALPIFIKFMEKAKQHFPDQAFAAPEGIKFVKVNAKTGRAAGPNTPAHDLILEALKTEEAEEVSAEQAALAAEARAASENLPTIIENNITTPNITQERSVTSSSDLTPYKGVDDHETGASGDLKGVY
jgi:penicillin-binding protein 1A